MTTRTKLQRLMEVFDPSSGTKVDFVAFDSEVEKLKNALTEKIQAQTIDDVLTKLDKFKKKLDFKGLFEAIDSLESEINEKIKEISSEMQAEIATLEKLLQFNDEESRSQVVEVSANISTLRQELGKLNEQKTGEIGLLKNKISQLQEFNVKANEVLKQIQDSIESNDKSVNEKIENFTKELEKLRREFNNRLGSLPRGGGNANRNISVGGNSSTLSKYTDINIKAGSNVTLTYSNNDATKNLDLTIAATGGSSSVAGTVRSINRVSTSQTMGSVAGTDYVYIADQGIQLTLPNATGITNLYTVKNVAASSVLVSTTSSQTIDTDSNLILATQYTAVDLINDGADNWSIT